MKRIIKNVRFNFAVQQFPASDFDVESQKPFLNPESLTSLSSGTNPGSSRQSVIESIANSLSTINEKDRESRDTRCSQEALSIRSSVELPSSRSSLQPLNDEEPTEKKRPRLKSIYKGRHSSTVSQICLGVTVLLCVSILACDIVILITDTWAKATTCVQYGLRRRRMRLTDSCILSLHLYDYTVPFATYARLKHEFCGAILDRTLEDRTLDCETFSKLQIESYLYLSALSVEVLFTVIVSTTCFRIFFYIKTNKYLSNSGAQQALRQLAFVAGSLFIISVLNTARVLRWNMFTEPIIQRYELDRHGVSKDMVHSMTYYVEITSAILSFCCLYLVRLVYLEIHPAKCVKWLATPILTISSEDQDLYKSLKSTDY